MKKTLALVLAMIMMFSFSSVAFAEEPAPVVNGEFAAIKAEIQVLRDELMGLRESHKSIRAQAIEKRDNIKSLFITAKEASLTEKIEAAKAFKVQLKAIGTEIKTIREDKSALWVQLKTAKTQKDFETVKANLTQIIALKKQIIEKANARLGLMDDIIDTLK
jgi:Zn-dependent M32 family carboxypeptidase